MHDDRSYTLAMLGWYLSEKRLEHIRHKKRNVDDIEQFFEIRGAKKAHSYF